MSSSRQFQMIAEGAGDLPERRQRRLTQKVQDAIDRKMDFDERRAQAEEGRRRRALENVNRTDLYGNDFVRNIVERQKERQKERILDVPEVEAPSKIEDEDIEKGEKSEEEEEEEIIEGVDVPDENVKKRHRTLSFDPSSPSTSSIPLSHYFWFDAALGSFYCIHGQCALGPTGQKTSDGTPCVFVAAIKKNGGVHSGNLNSHLNNHPEILRTYPVPRIGYANAGATLRRDAEDQQRRRLDRGNTEAMQSLMKSHFQLGKWGGRSGGDRVAAQNVTLVQAAFVAATRCSFSIGTSPWLVELFRIAAEGGNSGNAAPLTGFCESRHVLSGVALDTLYNFCVVEMESQLQRSAAFSISFDLWSSRNLRKSLCAVSYFFLDDDLEACEVVLDAVPMSTVRHDANTIAMAVATRVDSHTLDTNNLYSSSTDNAANVLNASSDLIRRHSEILATAASAAAAAAAGVEANHDDDDEIEEAKEEAEDGAHRYGDLVVGCVAHQLHLGVQELLRGDQLLREFVTQVQRVVVATRRSTKKQVALRQLQKEEGLPHGHARPLSLVISVSTRWNSMLAMVERFRTLWGYLATLFVLGVYESDRAARSEPLVLPSQDETSKIAGAIVTVLSPIRSLSEFVQGNSYSAAPHLPSLIWKLLDDLRELGEHPEELADNWSDQLFAGGVADVGMNVVPETTRRLAGALHVILKRRLETYVLARSPFIVAALLHPAHTRSVSNRLGQAGVENLLVAMGKIEVWLKIVRDEEDVAQRQRLALMATPAEEEKEEEVDVLDQMSDRDDLEVPKEGEKKKEVSLQVEIREFLKILKGMKMDWRQLSMRDADVKMRAFYLSLEGRNSSFRTVAKILFSVNASSATPERTFSCAGLIDGPLRANLGESRLEKLVVLGFYLKKIEKEGKAKDFIDKIKSMKY